MQIQMLGEVIYYTGPTNDQYLQKHKYLHLIYYAGSLKD